MTDPRALADCVARLRDAQRLALDTEGNGMHAHRTRLCVVQLCAASPGGPAEEVYVIDPLAVPDLSPLAALFGERGPEKIVHDVSFDARLLALSGLPLARVLDTSVHARFLGLAATGLGALLAARHNVAVSKAMQQDDWARRPLTPEQLAYLGDDVAHLGPLAASLEAEVAARGIAEEVLVETDYALANARAGEAVSPAYARIKGARELRPAARAALREMVAVREEAAERWDMPVGRVVSNQSLVNAAKARPRTVPEMRRAAGLHDRGAAIAAELLAALLRGEQAGDVPEAEQALFARERLPPGELAARKARESALAAWRKAESAARGVDLQVVLPGHAVQDLSQRGPATVEGLDAVPGLGAVRVARYGVALLDVIAKADESARQKAAERESAAPAGAVAAAGREDEAIE